VWSARRCARSDCRTAAVGDNLEPIVPRRCADFASVTATAGAQLATSLSESSDSAARRALIAYESTTGQILRRQNVNQEEFGGRRRALLRSRLFHYCHHCSGIRLWRYCSRRGRNRESSIRCISRSGDHHLSQTRVAHYSPCGARFASHSCLDLTHATTSFDRSIPGGGSPSARRQRRRSVSPSFRVYRLAPAATLEVGGSLL